MGLKEKCFRNLDNGKCYKLSMKIAGFVTNGLLLWSFSMLRKSIKKLMKHLGIILKIQKSILNKI
jgi:hypothetical protein